MNCQGLLNQSTEFLNDQMLEVNRFYCQGRSFGLYLIATPPKRVDYYFSESLFALEMVEVLIAIGLLPPKPKRREHSFYDYCSANEKWHRLKNQAILRYMIPQKIVARLDSEENGFVLSTVGPVILVNFRYLACIDGVLPEGQREELFNLTWHIEECIHRYGRVMDKFLEQKGTSYTRTLEDGTKESVFSPPVVCLAEYVRLIQSASLQGSVESESRERGFYRLRNSESSGFVKEVELAKEMGVTQAKLRAYLVKAGFLKPVQTGLKTSYEPTKKGHGYCDTAKGRMWHRSVIQLLNHAG